MKEYKSWPEETTSANGTLVQDLSEDGTCLPCMHAAKGGNAVTILSLHPINSSCWIKHQHSKGQKKAVANLEAEDKGWLKTMKKTGVT